MSLFSRKIAREPTVMFVIDSLEVGGAESQLVMLALRLSELGYRCEVFALRAEGALRIPLEETGIAIRDGGLVPERNRLKILKGFWRLWRSLIVMRPTVVHTFLPLSNLVGPMAAFFASTPMVISSRRGLGIHQDDDPKWKILDRIGSALSKRIAVNSRAVAVDTVSRDGVAPGKIACIYNGVDSGRFQRNLETRGTTRGNLGLADSEFAWINVANLASCKGHLDLLRGFSALLPADGCRLFLVGRDRGSQQGIEALAAELGISNRVFLLGNRSDVPELLSAMDGFVMSSHSEGFPNAILEAMSAGLPIVATDVGGCGEALQGGEAGILVPAHEPAALGRAMQEIMDSRQLRNALEAAASRTAREQYDVTKMVEAYLDLYRAR